VWCVAGAAARGSDKQADAHAGSVRRAAGSSAISPGKRVRTRHITDRPTTGPTLPAGQPPSTYTPSTRASVPAFAVYDCVSRKFGALFSFSTV
jgi:hypothetical protein